MSAVMDSTEPSMLINSSYKEPKSVRDEGNSNATTSTGFKDPHDPVHNHVHGSCPKRKILIFADIATVEDWVGLSPTRPHWSFLKSDPSGKDLYRGLYECGKQDSEQDYNCTIELTVSSDYAGQMPGKDAVILNCEPSTLARHKANILQHVKSNQTRYRDQLWIFYSLETPLIMQRMFPNFDNLDVHAIWSYHRDFQLNTNYGNYKKGAPTLLEQSDDSVESKTKLIKWVSKLRPHKLASVGIR